MTEGETRNPKPRGGPGYRGFVVVLVGVVMLNCCLIPWLMLHRPVDVNSFWPATGTTKEEIRDMYGKPATTYDKQDGTSTWFYSTDWIGFGGVGVNFDAQGRVASSFNH